jgi:hypothetical protein
MMTNLAIREQDLFRKLFEFLRYSIFLAFYVLSLQLIFITMNHRTINPLLLGSLLLGAAAFSWWKIHWSLYGLLIAIPFVNGLHLLDFIPPLSLLTSIFASIYLVWLPRRLFFEKETISPRTEVGHLVDILSGIVILSLIVTYLPYPLDVILHQFWRNPFEAYDELFFSTHGAHILLQGLFFYRVMELETKSQRPWKNIIPVLYIQASVIILFSIIQLIFRLPEPNQGVGIFAPFEDIHSYGSYIVVLFFFFLNMMFVGHLWHKLFNSVYMGFFFLFAVLSYSRATWLAVIVIGTLFILYKLSMRKRIFLISCILLVLLFINLSPDILLKTHQSYLQRLSSLVTRKGLQDVSVDGRIELWKRALGIMSDFPITGSGIGTFYRISPLYQDPDIGRYKDFYENAHNYFLQFASDLGLPALFVFMSILFFAYKDSFLVFRKNSESAAFLKGLLFGLAAYLITCLTGHPLLLSDQQFLFWFVITSIVVSRGFIKQQARSDKVFPKPRMLFFLLAAMLISAYAYDLWGMPRKQQYEYGFYGYEDWGGKKVRWTGKKAVSRTEVKGNLMSLEVFTSQYNIGLKGLNFKVFVNKKLWDEVNFAKSETRNLKYYIPYKKSELVEIKTEVDRTFIPIRLGLSKDSRNLGVAISEIKFSDELPKDGVGFFGMETWTGMKIHGWPKGMPLKFRWTGLRASMNIKGKFKHGVTLFLMSGHPDVGKNPVIVEILGGGGLIREIVLMDNQWKKVYLDQDMVKAKDVLTFQINRTFNPKLLGFSEDNRDLGVAVAVLQEK